MIFEWRALSFREETRWELGFYLDTCPLQGIGARSHLVVLGPWTGRCEFPCPQADCQNHGVKASAKPSPWGCLHWALTPKASSQ